MLCFFRQGCALIAGAKNDIVGSDLDLHAVFVGHGNTIVVNLRNLGFQMDRHFICFEEVTQEGGVGQTNTGGNDQIVHHFYDGGFLALQEQLISDLAACQAAADNGDILPNFLAAAEEVNGLDALIDAGNRDAVGFGTGGDDNFIGLTGGKVSNFAVELYFDLGILTQFPLAV